MLRGLFVTGTDTGVGKTVLAAALMHRYRAAARLRYWKPVQTGIEQDDDTATVRRLGGCEDDEIFDQGARLAGALSPHLAARLAGRTIWIEELLRLPATCAAGTAWVVEGAGGVLVPINESEMMADLIARLCLPAVVAARSSLGTINHTLLTLEALRGRRVRVAGAVLIGGTNPDNRAAIERYGGIPVLGEMPWFEPPTAAAIACWAGTGLDSAGLLAEFI